MDIVVKTKPNKLNFEIGDLVVIDGSPYLASMLLDSTHCLVSLTGFGLANGRFVTMQELIDDTEQSPHDIKVYPRGEYVFKLERRPTK